MVPRIQNQILHSPGLSGATARHELFIITECGLSSSFFIVVAPSARDLILRQFRFKEKTKQVQKYNPRIEKHLHRKHVLR
jgi:hypothetical protein